jgi:hypothetical protein
MAWAWRSFIHSFVRGNYSIISPATNRLVSVFFGALLGIGKGLKSFRLGFIFRVRGDGIPVFVWEFESKMGMVR